MRNLIIGLLMLIASPMGATAADTAADTCAPDGELKFICGVGGPEDLVPLPGGRWIVTGGMAENSGLHLINVAAKTAERWMPKPMDPASPPYQACPSPPAMDEFRAHGLSLRDRGQGRATLYVVNHGGRVPPTFTIGTGGRETIEVFDVDTGGAKPTLSWIGCVSLPMGLAANSVTSTPDGALLFTVFMHPGMRFLDYMAGRPTGAVYQWRPGEEGISRIWGTELTGNNGIEASPDGKIIYVVGSGGINVFSNTIPAKLLHHVPVTDGSTDNLRWADGRLIVAGLKSTADEDCIDVMKGMSGELGEKCIPGYFVAAMDPATLKMTTLAAGTGRKSYTGVATGLPVGTTLWLGSFNADKVAYRALP